MTPFRFFLTARHWQLFVLFMGVMFLAQFTGLFAAPTGISSPEEFRKAILPLLAPTALFISFLLAWFWSLGEFFWSLAPPSLRPSISRFRFSLVYPPLYIPVFFLLVTTSDPSQARVAIIFPLHLLGMYCMFYNLYFVAKTLKLAEVKTAVSFYDYSGAFFLLWFFPIGVWILQPRVNALVNRQA